MMPVPRFFADYQARVDAELRRLMPANPERVGEAMAYTLLAPAKRVRPVLTLLTAELCGGETAKAMVAACAVEMVHASSLILDDLPSMDDAGVRRGRPANHVVYGEAIAILAAFGLLDAAFGALARGYEPALASQLTALVSGHRWRGPHRRTGGGSPGHRSEITFEMLERIHRGKTGALFSAAATAGALTAGAPRESIASLQAFAKNLGLAFQIFDDLLDVEEIRRLQESRCGEGLEEDDVVSFSGPQERADRPSLPHGGPCAGAVRPSGARLRELFAFVAARTG